MWPPRRPWKPSRESWPASSGRSASRSTPSGPGPIKTALLKGVPDEKIDELLGRLAIPRLSDFADVNHVVDFFLSDQSDLVTGQVVYLGGAW